MRKYQRVVNVKHDVESLGHFFIDQPGKAALIHRFIDERCACFLLRAIQLFSEEFDLIFDSLDQLVLVITVKFKMLVRFRVLHQFTAI